MIVITAASGNLGRLVLEDLLTRGVPADGIRAVVRDRAKLADYAGRGVEVVRGDYNDQESLVAALAGADKFLLISSSGNSDERVKQHLNAVAAAKQAGVPHLVYTSIPHAEVNPIEFSWVHKDTETAIRQSGIAFTILRNNWYFENLLGSVGAALEHGAFIGSAGAGKVGYATRADYAAAAAAVLAGEGHEGKTYELTGDVAVANAEIAAEVSAQSGKQVEYASLPEQEYAKALEGFGLPAELAAALAQADVAISRGALAETTDTLSTLIGRPTSTVAEAVAQALKA
ncbi:SDR family oxidoreductase [Actinospica sp.]|jgi:NAD(P)H dehydrogenase (quinone)|uniref:SDR family oxidoreductase n=1 Tax=Actinospica sp. TaxID=1872142 RepID=UPI002D03A881|nr:SDR family oxidoreductase [Actinospica sp.]HWG26989.1 SDR family oxidoreductase [Actinospica sp.]